MMLRSAFSLVALLGVAACSSTPGNGIQPRMGPQAQSPSGGAVQTSAAAQEAAQIAGLQRALDTAAGGRDAMVAEEIVDAVFPDLGNATQAFEAGFAPFQNVCLSASPDLSALVDAAQRNGLTVERQGNTIVGGPENGAPVSLQINNATAFSFECGVTTLQDGPDDGTIRDAFFAQLGRPHSNGVGTITSNGETFILKHIAFSAFGATEHAFLLQQE